MLPSDAMADICWTPNRPWHVYIERVDQDGLHLEVDMRKLRKP